MARTLVTGMSATGKSTTIHQLVAMGLRAVDLDAAEWCHLVPDDSEYADRDAEVPLDRRWRAERVHALLTAERGSLFVAGTSTNQASIYPRLHHVVLLTVPAGIAVQRLADRSTNMYGKDPAELRREMHLRTLVEPRLRAGACLEIDTSTHSPAAVATMVSGHARDVTHDAD